MPQIDPNEILKQLPENTPFLINQNDVMYLAFKSSVVTGNKSAAEGTAFMRTLDGMRTGLDAQSPTAQIFEFPVTDVKKLYVTNISEVNRQTGKRRETSTQVNGVSLDALLEASASMDALEELGLERLPQFQIEKNGRVTKLGVAPANFMLEVEEAQLRAELKKARLQPYTPDFSLDRNAEHEADGFPYYANMPNPIDPENWSEKNTKDLKHALKRMNLAHGESVDFDKLDEDEKKYYKTAFAAGAMDRLIDDVEKVVDNFMHPKSQGGSDISPEELDVIRRIGRQYLRVHDAPEGKEDHIVVGYRIENVESDPKAPQYGDKQRAFHVKLGPQK